MFIRNALLFLLAAIIYLPSSAQQKDSIFLNNGQILIGKIENASLGEVSIDDIDLKMQNVKLYKIKRIVTFTRVKIEMVDKRILYGVLKPSLKLNHAEILLDDSTTITVHLTEINQLITLERNFFQRLSGDFSLGFSYAKSSGVGQASISAQVQYSTPAFENMLSMSSISSIDTSHFSRDQGNIALYSGYNINSTIFAAGMLQYQRNLELAIARRYQEMLGGGMKFFVRENWQLQGLTGLAINQEKSTDEGASSVVTLEIPVMVRFNLYKFRHPNIQITTSQALYFSLTDKGRVRFDGNTSFSWQLIRYFYLKINPYTNYDSKPPAGSSNFDYGITVGISYKF
ncbi:DUF481 domain-containing protein [Pinibacter aurantiacus]|uniref:DUF481 domain-containing protein n=1 Tax=Pinibacter aurantiacus TaxID=2851599 RepID=A0A9E2SFP3_9BACT|nr:DUF481 domain-containing protein [Pinibacter aurantiacus]MBV4360305.1 DUF481 domain-containing protein [Pinibacter aurantiacus]